MQNARSVRKVSVSLKDASWFGFLGWMIIKFNIFPVICGVERGCY